MSTKFLRICLFAIAPILLSSCAARFLGLLATEEVAILRTAGFRATASGFVLESESLLASQLARTRVLRGAAGRQLYVMENGKRKVFAELINSNTIRWTKSGTIQGLPGHLYGLRRGIGKANVRLGPGQHYPIYKKVGADELLIIIEENAGWFKVQLDNNTVGWILGSLIVAAADDDNEKSANNPAYKQDYSHLSVNNNFTQTWSPDYLQNTSVYKSFSCPTCNGSANAECYSCKGNGFDKCGDCRGSGYANCPMCNGHGHKECLYCSGKGTQLCSSCFGICRGCLGNGSVLSQQYQWVTCPTCKGTKTSSCNNCNNGLSYCQYCQGQKVSPCTFCKATGQSTLQCFSCYSKPRKICEDCMGKKYTRCYDCLGNGTLSIFVNEGKSNPNCMAAKTGKFFLFNNYLGVVSFQIYDINTYEARKVYSSDIASKTALTFIDVLQGSYRVDVIYNGQIISQKYFTINPCREQLVSLG